jgi:hypothetical protein
VGDQVAPLPDNLPEILHVGGRCLRVSRVFWTYWAFAAERQATFLRRLRGPQPWTLDPILGAFRFTNAYRASDRVSQYLIREIAYGADQDPRELFFRIILFKLFNKIETWELLKAHFGHISYVDYDFDAYDSVLTRALEGGRRIYSAAYIMPSGGRNLGTRKHRFHLGLLGQMMRDDMPFRIGSAKCMADAFALLRSYQSIGSFLAYQFATDLNYSAICNFDEMEFVVPGPGAEDGIRKCFPEASINTCADVIRMVADTQEEYFAALGLTFSDLWGRRLQLIDCQNLFCEVGKYARRAHPDVAGVTGRTRIKQLYRPSSAPLALFYPPKWGINHAIPRAFQA